MTSIVPPQTLGVIEARERLPQILEEFRRGSQAPVFIGSRRRTEAVIIPVDSYQRQDVTNRTKAAASALGSIRAEGGTPTPSAAAIVEQWTRGEMSTEAMKQQIYALHRVI